MTEPSDDAPNEILAEVKAHAATRRTVADHAQRWPLTSIGVGAAIGSAAVAAALLYAGRRGDREKG